MAGVGGLGARMSIRFAAVATLTCVGTEYYTISQRIMQLIDVECCFKSRFPKA